MTYAEQLAHAKAVKNRLWNAQKRPQEREVAEEAPVVAEKEERASVTLSGDLTHKQKKLSEYASPADMTRIEVAKVLQKHKVALKEIMSPCRGKLIVKARNEVAWHLVNVLGFSLSRAGRYLNRDHSTILHACRQHEAQMAEEVE